MTEQKIQEIEERLSKATPGPWEYDPSNWGKTFHEGVGLRNSNGGPLGIHVEFTETTGAFRADRMRSDGKAEADALLIANAPTDIRWLLDELKRVTARAERMKSHNKQMSDGIKKVAKWLNEMAIQSDRQSLASRGRFDSFADACAADAKNYRTTAKDILKALQDGEKE